MSFPCAVDPHPLLDPGLVGAELPAPLGALSGAPTGRPALPAPDDLVREAVRTLLRHGGFKPSGRSKPASEYLARVAAEGPLATINPVVDACNLASLHSGLPVSVVDLDRTEGALRLALAAAGARYVFNSAGQEIDVAGLLCLHDEAGPCANAVKDAQRTKTVETTRSVGVVVWGTTALPGRTAETTRWIAEQLQALGARLHGA